MWVATTFIVCFQFYPCKCSAMSKQRFMTDSLRFGVLVQVFVQKLRQRQEKYTFKPEIRKFATKVSGAIAA